MRGKPAGEHLKNGAGAVGKHVTESGRRAVQAKQASGRQGRQAASKGLHGGSSQETRPAVDQGGLVGKTQGRRGVSGFGPGKLPQEVGSSIGHQPRPQGRPGGTGRTRSSG